ncbi:DUF6301 family protein [Lentzea sp. HUAS12]|nr:DUF6301 family protein [Lentzea sp. HUAS12]USX53660.1 DUF6301 family protein [Lentzea sp. HUAS12]
MEWRAMAPAEACDLMDFWEAASWPLTRDEVQQQAVEWFGWTVEVQNGTPYLMNRDSGFTVPDVMTIGSRGDLSYLKFHVAGVPRGRLHPDRARGRGAVGRAGDARLREDDVGDLEHRVRRADLVQPQAEER